MKKTISIILIIIGIAALLVIGYAYWQVSEKNDLETALDTIEYGTFGSVSAETDNPGDPYLVIDETVITKLNDDMLPDAVVVLRQGLGGTGTFRYLAVVTKQDGEYASTHTLIGDRTPVDSLAVSENGVISIETVTHGPQDPGCCPTQPVTKQYVLTDEGLEMLAE